MMKPTFRCPQSIHFRWMAILIGILAAFSSASRGKDLALPTATAQPFSVIVHGENSERPVLLIPGLGSPGSVWNRTVDALLNEGYQLHVFTLAGFAGQPSIEGEFFPQVHRALLDYTRQLEAQPAIVGHSLGGALAFWLASSEPARFGRIVAVDGVPFLPALQDPAATEESVRPRAEQLHAMVSQMTPEAYDQQTAFTLSTMITDPEMVQKMALDSQGSDPQTIAAAMYDLMTRDLRDEISAIQSPVLLLAAGAPAPTPEAAKALKLAYESQVAKASEKRVEVIRGARHFIMLDAPNEFLALTLQHLAGE